MSFLKLPKECLCLLCQTSFSSWKIIYLALHYIWLFFRSAASRWIRQRSSVHTSHWRRPGVHYIVWIKKKKIRNQGYYIISSVCVWMGKVKSFDAHNFCLLLQYAFDLQWGQTWKTMCNVLMSQTVVCMTALADWMKSEVSEWKAQTWSVNCKTWHTTFCWQVYRLIQKWE